VPRDTNSSFDPQIVKKRQRRLTGIDEIVLSLTAKGLTTGEVAAHFADVYGATVSKGRVVQPAVVSGGVHRRDHVKVGDGQVTNRTIYVAVGLTCAGERDILGLWAGDGGEGSSG
jgi:putative transposase